MQWEKSIRFKTENGGMASPPVLLFWGWTAQILATCLHWPRPKPRTVHPYLCKHRLLLLRLHSPVGFHPIGCCRRHKPSRVEHGSRCSGAWIDPTRNHSGTPLLRRLHELSPSGSTGSGEMMGRRPIAGPMPILRALGSHFCSVVFLIIFIIKNHIISLICEPNVHNNNKPFLM